MAESTPNEITKFNYESGLKELIGLVKISDFVAIDCTVETTGFLLQDETLNSDYLSDAKEWSGSWYDTIKSTEKSRYLVEVGVAVFKRVPTQPMELEVEVFNIPVLPASIDDNELARFRGRTSVRLQFDGYGQEFIRNVEFDLNKVFYMGAPFLNRQLQEQAERYMVKNPKFMVANRKRRLNPNLMPEIFEEVTEKERKSIIQRLKGVSKLFEAISQYEIPAVGHHVLLKLIFIYKDFFEYLPDTYPEFIDTINGIFKVIYDTKQMAQDLLKFDDVTNPAFPLKQLKLGKQLKLYDLVRNLNTSNAIGRGFKLHVGERSKLYVENLLDLQEGYKVEEESDGFCYVAGFDALTCGVLFLDLVSTMGNANLDCGQKEPTKGDCLDMFLKGDATFFKNNFFEAPKIPDRESATFVELMKKKKDFWRQRLEDEEKRRQEIANRTIVETYNLANVTLKTF